MRRVPFWCLGSAKIQVVSVIFNYKLLAIVVMLPLGMVWLAVTVFYMWLILLQPTSCLWACIYISFAFERMGMFCSGEHCVSSASFYT